MACGHKTDNNVLGMNQAGESCKSILEEAIEQGYATGMVVTSSIQHATPGAFVSHRPARNLYEDITKDLLNSGIDLFIGGGKQFFDRRETDDQNLLKALKDKGFSVHDYFNDDLSTVMPDPSKRFAFLTADNQPLPAFQGRDYLPIASKKAAEFLKLRSDKGFFLMIEGSQIDWSCHANQVEPMYAELEDFDKAIEQAMKFARVDGETLVIVTADVFA